MLIYSWYTIYIKILLGLNIFEANYVEKNILNKDNLVFKLDNFLQMIYYKKKLFI